MFFVPSCQMRFNASLAKFFSVSLGVIRTICINFAGANPGMAWFPSNWRDPVNQWEEAASSHVCLRPSMYRSPHLCNPSPVGFVGHSKLFPNGSSVRSEIVGIRRSISSEPMSMSSRTQNRHRLDRREICVKPVPQVPFSTP